MKIDCREPQEYKDLFPDAEIVKLVVGDFTNSDKKKEGNIVIERKKAPDFVASVLDGRLWKQLENMRQSRSVLLIEGDLNKAVRAHAIRSKRPYVQLWNIVYGSYTSLVARENYKNIKIAHVSNKAELKYMIPKLLEKCDYKYKVVNRTKSPNHALNILVGFPGVSVVRAIKLLKVYETAEGAIQHMNEWEKVVGKAVKQRCVTAYKSPLQR